jgi:hypothetical protein
MADLLARSSFALGWRPDLDAVGAPPNALLRMDNLVLEGATPVLRPPARKIAFYADLDVHSLFTSILSGTRYRLVGAGDTIYINGSPLVTSVDGSNDVAFGSAFGQILMARGTTRHKYHGTLAPWGLDPPGTAPTVAPVASDGKTFFDGTVATMVQDEGDDETPQPMAAAVGYDLVAGSATAFWPKPSTKRAVITHQMGAPTDFTTYDAGATGTPDDLITLYFYAQEPTKIVSVRLIVDVHQADFREDWYEHSWAGDEFTPLTPGDVPIQTGQTPAERQAVIDKVLEWDRSHGRDLDAQVLQNALAQQASTIRQEAESWSKLQVRRGGMTRVGSTTGANWTTVGAVRVIVTTTGDTECRLDLCRLIENTISGTYKWCCVNANDTGTYVALSGPSPLSAEVQIQAQAADITVPSGPGTSVWVFRMGGILDTFYRVAVLSAAGGTVRDLVSDVEALSVNIKLEADNTLPPSGIIGIAGPYYDRTMCLTSDGYLWVSRRRNPESFATGQAIRVCGAEERALWVRQSLGGLHVGTTRDIYRIEGTGAELPDGTIDLTKTGLHVDHPPITDGVAQDGNLLLYVSRLGWRAISGAGSQSIVGDTAKLYQNQVRHGVGPINLASGRFRATIGNQQLLALTPEASETTATATIYRNAPADGQGVWYRTYYPTQWRSLYTEPDGTILAGDTAGQVWQIDAPGYTHGDDGDPIYVELWTPVDDDGKAFQRKDPEDLRVSVATGTGGGTGALHFDGSGTPAVTFAVGTATGDPPSLVSLAAIAATPFWRAQLRVTHAALDGSFAFKFRGFGLAYRAHPLLQLYADLKPDSFSLVRRRFAGLGVQIDTLGQPATVTPVLDGTALTPLTVTTSDALNRHLDVVNAVGRDLWAKISSATGFEVYGGPAPVVVQQFPPVWFGGSAPQVFASDGVKSISGAQLRVCTLGATATFTLKADGRTVGAFTGQSTLDDPIDLTFDLVTAVEGVEFALYTSVDVELYSWRVLVSARRPLGLLTYASGPIDLGNNELVWIRRLEFKARVTRPISVDAYLDGRLLATETSAAVAAGTDTVVAIDFGRGVMGYQPSLVVRSSGRFFPYWLRVSRRVTGMQSDKPTMTVPLRVEGEGHGVA